MSWLNPTSLPLVVALAVLLDLLLGDPQNWPHPVRWIGAAITAYERRIRRMAGVNLRFAGVVLALALPLACYGLVAGVLWLLGLISPWLAFGLSVYLAYTCLSLAGLGRAVSKVGVCLAAGDLDAARQAVGHVVGRDTAELDSSQVAGAAVESAAENCSDGIIAPLFFLMLGGPALGLAYKAINTADSMVGYKNSHYAKFGWGAAKLDDLANWLPARLTALLFVVAALLTGARPFKALLVALRDARRHASPNAGWPEAAVAGALGVALGGTARYGGNVHYRPVLGGEGIAPAPAHVAQVLKLMWTAGALGTLAAVGLA
jgi:adenosylcobinamide-phosphate synthase